MKRRAALFKPTEANERLEIKKKTISIVSTERYNPQRIDFTVYIVEEYK